MKITSPFCTRVTSSTAGAMPVIQFWKATPSDTRMSMPMGSWFWDACTAAVMPAARMGVFPGPSKAMTRKVPSSTGAGLAFVHVPPAKSTEPARLTKDK